MKKITIVFLFFRGLLLLSYCDSLSNNSCEFYNETCFNAARESDGALNISEVFSKIVLL